MKIFYAISLLLFCFSANLFAQNEYYDSKTITEKGWATYSTLTKNAEINVTRQNADSILKLLFIYLPESEKQKVLLATNAVDKFKVYKDEFSANPFIEMAGAVADNPLTGIVVNSTNGKSFLNTLGGMDVTNFADGIASFLVERGKEEMNVAFFERLQIMFEKEAPELKILFPYTTVLLDNFKSWEYANILMTLQASFDKDLQNLIGNITKLNTLTISNEYNKNVKKRITAIKDYCNSDQGKWFFSALMLSDGFIQGNKLPDVIDKVTKTYLSSMYDSDFQNTARLQNIIGKSLRNNSIGKNYISANEFNTMVSNDTWMNLYLGLLYQQIKNENITIANNKITNLITGSTVAGIREYIQTIIKQSDYLTAANDRLVDARKRGEKDLSSYFIATFASASDFLRASANIQLIHSSLTFPPGLSGIIYYTEQALVAANDISSKNYNAAVIEVVKLMSDIDTLKAVVNNPEFKIFKENFIAYTSFFANIVKANNSEEVKSAIKAIAMPSGSYSVKRNSKYNIALNGYIGIAYDWGNPFGLNREGRMVRNHYNLKWNIYAPVGFSFSRGTCIGAFSAFLSVIDVGSIANFRLYNDSTLLTRKITINDIFSPGLNLVYGIPKSPLSIAGGIIYKPSLLYNNNQNGFVDVPGMLRANVSLLIDIPILNIFTKSK